MTNDVELVNASRAGGRSTGEEPGFRNEVGQATGDLAITRSLGHDDQSLEHPPEILDDVAERALQQAIRAGLLDRRGDPARLGRFAILERIGAGAMGEVFAAYDEQLDRKVALKIVHPAAEACPTSQSRLLREARALARLSHPNVVTVFDSGLEDGRVFIAMEFVRGRTLRAWLSETHRSWEEILEVFIAAGRGLQAMHELGLVHRDFKPSNVLIDERGRPRLIDFGLVGGLVGGLEGDEGDAPRSADGGAGELGAHLDRLTRTGTVMGTPRYMSPEQFQGRAVSAASDQFSFCVCLFEALYERAPFAGDSLDTLEAAVLDGRIEVPPTSEEIPAALGPVILQGLQRDPGARWPRMEDLLAVLGTVLADVESRLDDPRAQRNHRRTGAVLAALTASILAIVLLLVGVGSIEFSAANAVATDFVVLATTGGAALALRMRWQANTRARRHVGFFFLVVTTYGVQDLVGYLVDRSLHDTMLCNTTFLTVICFFVAPLLGPALRLCCACAALFTVLLIVDHSHYFAYFIASNLSVALITSFALLRTRAALPLQVVSADGTSGSNRTPRDSPHHPVSLP
jgi:serine/threonine protein kinase